MGQKIAWVVTLRFQIEFCVSSIGQKIENFRYFEAQIEISTDLYDDIIDFNVFDCNCEESDVTFLSSSSSS